MSYINKRHLIVLAVGGTVAARETHMAGLAASWTRRERISAFNSWGGRGSGMKEGLEMREAQHPENTAMPGFPKYNAWIFLMNIYMVLILG